jgi:hypothetical protein
MTTARLKTKKQFQNIERQNKFTEDSSFRRLSIYTGIMHLGLFLTLVLMLYKGMAYVHNYPSIPDLTKIDLSLFGGNRMIRILAYSVSHIAMAIGLFGVGIFILRNIKTK